MGKVVDIMYGWIERGDNVEVEVEIGMVTEHSIARTCCTVIWNEAKLVVSRVRRKVVAPDLAGERNGCDLIENGQLRHGCRQLRRLSCANWLEIQGCGCGSQSRWTQTANLSLF